MSGLRRSHRNPTGVHPPGHAACAGQLGSGSCSRNLASAASIRPVRSMAGCRISSPKVTPTLAARNGCRHRSTPTCGTSSRTSRSTRAPRSSSSATSTGPIEFPFYQVPTPRGTFRFQRNRTGVQEARRQHGRRNRILGCLDIPAIRRSRHRTSSRQKRSAHAFYFQDDWKVTSKLTLNLGVRYELFSPISERFGRQSNYDSGLGDSVHSEGQGSGCAAASELCAASFPEIKVESRRRSTST